MDRTRGIWRRLLLIPFNIIIPPERIDKRLPEKLLKELPGIFNWALEGLYRLSHTGKLTIPEVSKQALREYELDCNPTRVFFDECVEEAEGREVPAIPFYQTYVFWMIAHGNKPVGERLFGKEIKRAFPAVKRVYRGSRSNRFWAYKGIVCDEIENKNDDESEDIDGNFLPYKD